MNNPSAPAPHELAHTYAYNLVSAASKAAGREEWSDEDYALAVREKELMIQLLETLEEEDTT